MIWNETTRMNIFFLVCAALLSITAGLTTEEAFYGYTAEMSDVRAHIHNFSDYMSSIDNKIQMISKEFYWNISSLRSQYGSRMDEHFQKKYRPKAAHFLENSTFAKDCSQYIENLLKDNRQHQIELNEYIDTAVYSVRKIFGTIYEELAVARGTLGALEMDAYNCGLDFQPSQIKAPFNCAWKILDRVMTVRSEAVARIYIDMISLEFIKATALRKVHVSVRDRFIPDFYRESGIDGWLNVYCPE
uniref:CEP112 protein n=1 Tax=Fopius arisanus TaxID=64838 RepID=A0A0C9S1V2_9HYME